MGESRPGAGTDEPGRTDTGGSPSHDDGPARGERPGDADRRPEPLASLRYQLLGIELSLLGGVVLLGIPLAGATRLVPWAFMLGGLVAVLFGAFR